MPIRPPLFRSFATFGVFVAFLKVAAVPCRPGEQDSERTMTEASDLWFERVEKAIRDLNQVLEEQRRVLLEQATSRAHLLRAAAVATLLLSSASYAQAYDYVDAHGYRHWCHQANCGDRKNKAVDENDLAWQPPPGVKWQVVDDPAKSSQLARD
jgi:hypothetical protein